MTKWDRYYGLNIFWRLRDIMCLQFCSKIIKVQCCWRNTDELPIHINIRYFFVTDCIQREGLTVEYCPTDDMLGDFGTKPLQGKKFLDFWRMLLNEE
mmetsp:Transcript_37303/g.52664  ORF Transcript_37303/g.52664 Transcript_37303/m.52664 type:complete len:97 (+) Transcript_37303:159-449(+)